MVPDVHRPAPRRGRPRAGDPRRHARRARRGRLRPAHHGRRGHRGQGVEGHALPPVEHQGRARRRRRLLPEGAPADRPTPGRLRGDLLAALCGMGGLDDRAPMAVLGRRRHRHGARRGVRRRRSAATSSVPRWPRPAPIFERAAGPRRDPRRRRPRPARPGAAGHRPAPRLPPGRRAHPRAGRPGHRPDHPARLRPTLHLHHPTARNPMTDTDHSPSRRSPRPSTAA